MRDRTKAAGAVLRSEVYRGTHRNVAAGPLGVAVPPRPRAENGASAPGSRVGSRVSSRLAALALLGLLDLFGRG